MGRFDICYIYITVRCFAATNRRRIYLTKKVSNTTTLTHATWTIFLFHWAEFSLFECVRRNRENFFCWLFTSLDCVSVFPSLNTALKIFCCCRYCFTTIFFLLQLLKVSFVGFNTNPVNIIVIFIAITRFSCATNCFYGLRPRVWQFALMKKRVSRAETPFSRQ